VASLFPPEVVIHATQMTPQALFHMKPGSLRHRFIVAGERSRAENDDTADATRALREMISSGWLTKLMPMKVRGEIQTVTIDQEGPIAYVESKLAEGYSGVVSQNTTDQIIDRHHALQRVLQECAVVAPFAGRLGELVTHKRVEARRAFPQLMSMVQASALLHQRQRQVDNDGRLVAEPDDYQLARYLLLNPLGRLLGGRLSDPAARFHTRLRERFVGGATFTRRDAT